MFDIGLGTWNLELNAGRSEAKIPRTREGSILIARNLEFFLAATQRRYVIIFYYIFVFCVASSFPSWPKMIY